jgi:hypothetical protein
MSFSSEGASLADFPKKLVCLDTHLPPRMPRTCVGGGEPTMPKRQLASLTIGIFLTVASLGSAQSDNCALPDGAVPDNVRSIARNLRVCGDLLRLFEAAARKANAAQLNSENLLAQGDKALSEEARVQLEARQQISEAATRTALNSNLLQSQIQEIMLRNQSSILVDEKRAYRRTKILNAFLGTTVGAVGTGLQFSDSVHVQHVGDGIGVAGGAITAIFALCTADVYVTDSPPDQLFLTFQSRNQDHAIPDEIWSYLKDDSALLVAMDEAAKAPPAQKKFLSCHYKGAPKEQKEARNKAITLLNRKLLFLNHDVVDLLNAEPTR